MGATHNQPVGVCNPHLDVAWRLRQHLADRENLRVIVTKLHDRHGMSLREIARVSGLSATYLSLVMNRKQVISFGAYLRLVDVADNRADAVSDLDP
jgi:AraC-like DNA-binding protein